jgi:hypothetical protein
MESFQSSGALWAALSTTKVYSLPSLFPSLFLCYFISTNTGKWGHQWAYEVAFPGRGICTG